MKTVKKGQESAPIELLIGVTILTFVLILGFYILKQSSSQQYEQKLRASFSNFARDIEAVYLGSVGTSFRANIDFTPPTGSGDAFIISSIQLKKGVSTTCTAQLGRSDCLELYAYKTDKYGNTNLFLAEVINIPSTISVKGEFSRCGGEDLNEINYNDESNENCFFSPTAHSFILTKTAADEIEIKEG